MLLYEYENGNTKVKLYSDGTKVRSWPDFTEPEPEYPESIDLKITGFCDLHKHCKWCHEDSTPAGQHGSTEQILELLRGLPQGTELAIGGGNPLAYPGIVNLLASIKEMGLVPNITINALHLDRFKDLIDQCLPFVYGVGVSYNEHCHKAIQDLKARHSHVVLHVIAGIQSPEVLTVSRSLVDKVLILGYKTYGRGVNYLSPAVTDRIEEWRKNWRHLAQGMLLCFDNLALLQLDTQKQLPEDLWEKHYMGNDGKFSMYIDASTWSYSRSSREDRLAIPEDATIKQLFNTIQHAYSN